MVEYVFVLSIVLLIVIDIRKKSVSDGETFDLESTAVLKGFCALLILFNHLSLKFKGPIFENAGFLGVSGFLFASGYGLTASFRKKGSRYLHEIIRKKIPIMLAHCLFALFYIAVFVQFFQGGLIWDDLFTLALGNRLLNWYFPMAILLYLTFALCAFLARDDTRRLTIISSAIFALLFVFLSVFYKIINTGNWRLYGFFSFYTGILCANSRKSLKWMHGWRILLPATLFALLFAYTCYFRALLPVQIPGLVLQACLTFALFSLAAYGLASRVKSKGVFRTIGNCSSEMILAQGLSLELFRCNVIYVENLWLYILLSICIQFLLVVITKRIDDWMTVKITSFQHDPSAQKAI